MAHHHRYSKRSRESRKAMTDGISDQPEFPDGDDGTVEDWQSAAVEPGPPPDPVA